MQVATLTWNFTPHTFTNSLVELADKFELNENITYSADII
jgi:hypothetical protein